MKLIIVSQAQMDALSHAMRRRFAESSARDIRCRFREFVVDLDNVELVQRISKQIDCAESFGVCRECDVLRFLEFEILYGPGFPGSHKTPGDILRRRDLDGARKIEMIENWEMFERPSHVLLSPSTGFAG